MHVSLLAAALTKKNRLHYLKYAAVPFLYWYLSDVYFILFKAKERENRNKRTKTPAINAF